MSIRSMNCSVWAITLSRSAWSCVLLAVDARRRQARVAARQATAPTTASSSTTSTTSRASGTAAPAEVGARRLPASTGQSASLLLGHSWLAGQGLEEQPLPRLLSQGARSHGTGRRRPRGRASVAPGELAGRRVVRRHDRRSAYAGRARAGRSGRRGRWSAVGGSAQRAFTFIGRLLAVLRRPGVGALVALRGRPRAVGEDHAEVGVVEAGVRRLRDHREATLDDVGVEHQDLLDAVEVLDDDLAGGDQVVDQVAELDLVLLEEGPQLVGRGAAGVDEAAQVRVGAGQRAAEQPGAARRSCGSRGSESIWPCRTVLLSLISAVVTSKLSLAVVDERVAAVDDRLEVLAGAAEGSAELVDGGLQVVLVDRLHGLDRSVSRVSVAIGIRVSSRRDLRVVVQERAVVASAAGARRTAHPRRTGCRPRRGRRQGSRRSSLSMSRSTSTPASVSSSSFTLPTRTPR